MDRRLLAELVSAAGVADRDSIEKVLADPKYHSTSAVEALVTSGTIEEWRLCEILAPHYGVPLIHLNEADLKADTVKLINPIGARNYCVVPINVKGKVLTLAMADPGDLVGDDAVRYVTHLQTERVMAPRSEILRIIDHFHNVNHGTSIVQSFIDRLPEMADVEFQKQLEEAPRQEEEQIEAGPIIKLVNSIVVEAIRMRASDIHIEPQEGCIRLRYRIDGILQIIAELPKNLQLACTSRLKLTSGMDISEKRKPQDGRARVHIGDDEVDLRVNTIPTLYGEKIVMRLLDSRKVKIDLEDLGFQPRDFERFTRVISSSQGMILITGPTGSGKTSTLYSALERRNKPTNNIITVEDPIEYHLQGITQVQVHNRAGVTFASALRAILRQDPDIVMVGEIRDLETAEIATDAAQTGHLLLSTLHTNDAASTVTRLVQMGLPTYMVAASLSCVVAQRLVRRLCKACKTETVPEESTVKILAILAAGEIPEKFFVGRGCESCNFSGYMGRVGLYEVLVVTDRIRDMIFRGATAGELLIAARQEGMTTMMEDGLRKVFLGLTSADELARVITAERTGGRACPECGRKMGDNFVVCPYCDEGVGGLCPGCAKPLSTDWPTCPYCRYRIHPPSPKGRTVGRRRGEDGIQPVAVDVSPTMEGAAVAVDVSPRMEGAAVAVDVSPTMEGAAVAVDVSPTMEGAAVAVDVSPTMERAVAVGDESAALDAALAQVRHSRQDRRKENRPVAVERRKGERRKDPSSVTRILLATDDAALRETTRSILQGRGGYEVLLADDGIQALNLARSRRPNVIISDVVLPEMNGVQLVRQLRTHLSTALIPVVLLTSREGDEDKVQGLEAAADDYLLKPFHAERLLTRVGALVRRTAAMMTGG